MEMDTDEVTKIESVYAEDGKKQDGIKSDLQSDDNVDVNVEIENLSDMKMLFKIRESPPFHMTLFFALQQMLTSFSASMTASVLAAELFCSDKDEAMKAKLLSTTALCNGVSTFFMVTFGSRLPIFQGPTASYLVPLLAMMTLPSWQCPQRPSAANNMEMYNITNVALNTTADILDYDQFVNDRMRLVSGSMLLAGVVHAVLGATGLVGILLKLIGPITIVCWILLIGLAIAPIVVKFCSVQWGIAGMTLGIALILSLYMKNIKVPIIWWSREKGFHVTRSIFHNLFSILIAMLISWFISFILTSAGVFSSENNSVDFYARTDSRTYVIGQSPWFYLPYPGQFGPPTFSAATFINFLLASLASILDSIGDYYACARTCRAPPPPAHAVNRGIMVEGLGSCFSALTGVGYATTSYGGNIGVIGITRVASRRVFQVLAMFYIVIGIFSKFAAFLISIPYPVLGGIQIIGFGIFIGILFSNLQLIDLSSTRNLAIIGISLIAGLIIPEYVKTNRDSMKTGIISLDQVIEMLLANPGFPGGFLACFLDNTVSGTLEERGMRAWLGESGETNVGEQKTLDPDFDGLEAYDFPFLPHSIRWGRVSRYIPFMPGFKKKNV